MNDLAFTVMTFNIRNSRAFLDGRHWWRFRRDAVVDVLSRDGVDVVGLQEVRSDQLHFLRKRFPRHLIVSGGRGNGRNSGEHCTVLIDPHRFDVIDWEVRWFSLTPSGAGSRDPEARHPRIATFVDLRDRKCDQRLTFVNLHLDSHSAAARERATHALADRLETFDRPAIVAGDFNCSIDDRALAPLWNVGLRDALAHVPARGEGAGTAHAFTGTTNGTRIDHILVPPTAHVTSSAIDFQRPRGRLSSDHWPVLATIAFDSSGSSQGADTRQRPEAEGGLSFHQ